MKNDVVAALNDSDLVGWFPVRIDEGGFAGRQPNIRATSNQRFAEHEFSGSEDDRRVAESFIGLSTSYWQLDPNVSYRVRVTYGTPEREPRIQSLTADGFLVHPPLRIPVGHVESFVFDIPTSPQRDGRLSLQFVPHALPELAGQTDRVADPPIVNRVELFSDSQPPLIMIDCATVPDGSIAVALRTIPELAPIGGAHVTAFYPDGSQASASTNGSGDAIVSSRHQATLTPLGSNVTIKAIVDGKTVTGSVIIDEAFAATWPILTLPTRASDGRCMSQNLDGEWDFVSSWQGSESQAEWTKIQVPGQWFQQGFDVRPGESAAYRRSFKYSLRENRRAVLRFDAVYSYCSIWLNGVELGDHEGGFTPFQFDITDCVTSHNELVVVVRSDSISDEVSAASDYAAHSLGGVTRQVSVLDLPQRNLERIHVDTTFSGGAGTARVFGTVSGLNNDGVARVKVRIVDSDNQELALESIDVEASEPRFSQTVSLNDVRPWTAETPILYDLIVSLDDAEEYVSRRFGFRSVEVVGHELRVNGSPIRLRGVERHEQDPLRGRSTLPELWNRDVELMKEANINNVFTCHYPHAEGFLDLCDERGLWVIDESPTVWVDSQNADDPDIFLALTRPILEMIERDWSRPGVVVWMLGDECLWGRNFWRLVLWLRNEGLHAPLMFSFDIGGASSLDIASRHYPPLEFASVLEGVHKPVTFDQFAHLNCYNRREVATDPEVRDWWGSSLQDYWQRMEADPRILGGQIWAWSDDEFHLDDSRMIGYGTWGIVDAWRRPKPEWWNVKMAYSPVRIGDVVLPSGVAGPVEVRLENRYDFLDLESVEIQWTAPTESGRARAACAPRSDTSLTIELTNPLSPGEEVLIEIVDSDGRLITAAALAAGGAVPKTDRKATFDRTGPLRIVDENRAHIFAPNMPEYDAHRIYSGDHEWMLDYESGLVRAGRLARRAIVQGGPELMLLSGIHTQHVGPHHRHGIEPFTDSCENRVVREVIWKPEIATMEVHAEYEEADSLMSYTVRSDGALDITYSATARVAMEVRQTGIVIDLPAQFSKLRWSRDTFWRAYPETHIGRASGTALADPGTYSSYNHDGRAFPPVQAWEDDVTSLGSADFRSTRRDIHWASLTDHAGVGLWVEPREQTQVRAWRAGDIVRLLIASHTSGGSEPLMARAGQQDHTRRWLSPGDQVSGSVRLRLGRLLSGNDAS